MGAYDSNPYNEQGRGTYAMSQPATSRPGKRRAEASTSFNPNGKEVIDLTSERTPPKKRKRSEPAEEKRLRRWRQKPPQTYYEIRDRALTQRMFVLDRQRDDSCEEHPVETISLAGTTGNVYQIKIDKAPNCNCPHALKGNQCKHIIYVLVRVLRVRRDLEYQLAFISSELREIFANAPPLPAQQGGGSKKDGNRKPIEGECPICCEDFEPENRGEEIVYCKSSCGNNVHKECFQKWAASNRAKGPTCPFCRSPWQDDGGTLTGTLKQGVVNGEGYVNVADQLGISRERDYSTYNPYWVRRQMTDDWF